MREIERSVICHNPIEVHEHESYRNENALIRMAPFAIAIICFALPFIQIS